MSYQSPEGSSRPQEGFSVGKLAKATTLVAIMKITAACGLDVQGELDCGETPDYCSTSGGAGGQAGALNKGGTGGVGQAGAGQSGAPAGAAGSPAGAAGEGGAGAGNAAGAEAGGNAGTSVVGGNGGAVSGAAGEGGSAGAGQGGVAGGPAGAAGEGGTAGAGQGGVAGSPAGAAGEGGTAGAGQGGVAGGPAGAAGEGGTAGAGQGGVAGGPAGAAGEGGSAGQGGNGGAGGMPVAFSLDFSGMNDVPCYRIVQKRGAAFVYETPDATPCEAASKVLTDVQDGDQFLTWWRDEQKANVLKVKSSVAMTASSLDAKCSAFSQLGNANLEPEMLPVTPGFTVVADEDSSSQGVTVTYECNIASMVRFTALKQ